MTLKIKIYSCYYYTYSRVYKDIISCLYPEGNYEKIELDVIDISNEAHLGTVQSQRSLDKYVTRTIRIYEDDKLVHIVGMSNTNFDFDKQHEKELDPTKKYVFGALGYHANTYLKQGTAKIFNYYFDEKKRNPDIQLSFYLLDIDQSYPHNLFNVLSYRELQTIGFRVLNIGDVDFSEYNHATGSAINGSMYIGFSSFIKYINDIELISGRNGGNNSSFIDVHERLTEGPDGDLYFIDKYVYTFKSLSAQDYDSLFRLWCMKILADKENVAIEFRLGKQYFNYDAEEYSIADKLTAPTKEAFENAGITIDYDTSNEFMIEKNLREQAYLSAKKNNEPRNQTLFRSNLYRSGMPIRCAICGEDNPTLLKAAHLWEVHSIRVASAHEVDSFLRDNGLDKLLDQNSTHRNELFYKKYCLTNTGYNGIWLCGKHHDEFDRNLFFIETLKNKIAEMVDSYNHIHKELPEVKLPPESIAFLNERNRCFNNPATIL